MSTISIFDHLRTRLHGFPTNTSEAEPQIPRDSGADRVYDRELRESPLLSEQGVLR